MTVKSLFGIFSAPAADQWAPAEDQAAVMDHMTDEETIRELAYHLWEEAGRPEGDGVDFWIKAERLLSDAP